MSNRIVVVARAAVLALVCLLLTAGTAMAQSDEQRAETLFREGRDAMQRGEIATACKKFSDSLQITKRPSTLLNLAQCEEQQTKLVSALAHWKEALELLPPNDERVAVTKERMATLEKKLPRLTIKLEADSPKGTRVTLDGRDVADDSIGTPVPVDPGQHALSVIAPNRVDQRSTVTVIEGEKKEVTLTAGAATEDAPAPTTPKPVPTAPATGSDGSGRRTAGFVIGGVGLLALIGAGVTGALVVANDSTIEEECPNQRCSTEGLDEISTSETLMVLNAIGLGVGVVGLGVGTVLVLTAGGSSAPEKTGRAPRRLVSIAPVIGPAGGAAVVRAAF